MTFNAGFGDRSIRINSFEVVEFSSFDRPCIRKENGTGYFPTSFRVPSASPQHGRETVRAV